jgi:hypothetical protein
MSKKTAATAKVNPGGVMKTATTTKTTTKPKMSAKRYAQYLRYVRRHPAKTAKAKKARKLAGPCAGGWVAGGNDIAETCAMTAVANSLLFSSGLRAADEEILAFGEGLTIAEALELAAARGLAGIRLREFFPVDAVLPGAVVGLDLDEGSHAALLAGGGLMVSWGGLIPARGVVEEAWALDWGLAC